MTKARNQQNTARRHARFSNRVVKPALPHSEPPSPVGTMTVQIPIVLKRRGGRKRIVTPSGAPSAPVQGHQLGDTLIRALARAHRWRRMLESGRFGSLTELAAAEKVNQSYLCRTLRLTLLAPQIIEAALNGSRDLPNIAELGRPFPLEWQHQTGRWLDPRLGDGHVARPPKRARSR